MKVLSTALLLAASSFGWLAEPHIVSAQEGQGSPSEGRTRPAERTRPPGEQDKTPPTEPGTGVERPKRDVFGRMSRVRNGTLADKLKGGWRLKELVIPGSRADGRVAQGFMHIGEGLMSFEVHAAWNDAALSNGQVESDVHTTFTAEYIIGAAQTLECTTIIGSFLDEQTGELRWERSGFRRKYSISLDATKLKLSFGQRDGKPGLMVFEPYHPVAGGARDVFGRAITPGGAAGVDMFGRPTAASASGERDVFGRPKPAEDEGEGEGDEAPEGENKPPATTGGAGGR